jgi:hypothetical protein
MNNDGIKAKIEWYKHLFTFSSAIDVACIAWQANNYAQAEKIISFLNIATIFFFGIIASFTGYKTVKYIKKLE